MCRSGIRSETLVTLKPQGILPSVPWLSRSHVHVVWMTPVNIYPCPCLLLSPQVTSLQSILSVGIHSTQQESPQTAETKRLQQGVTFPTLSESEWQAVSQHSASIHQHLHHLYPALHLSAALSWLSEWAALPAPVTVTAVITRLLTALLTWAGGLA